MQQAFSKYMPEVRIACYGSFQMKCLVLNLQAHILLVFFLRSLIQLFFLVRISFMFYRLLLVGISSLIPFQPCSAAPESWVGDAWLSLDSPPDTSDFLSQVSSESQSLKQQLCFPLKSWASIKSFRFPQSSCKSRSALSSFDFSSNEFVACISMVFSLDFNFSFCS